MAKSGQSKVTATYDCGCEQHLEEILYAITHEVRASLRALTILPQMINEDLAEKNYPGKSEVFDQLNMVQRHARRVDQMFLDLRTYSRVGLMTERSSIVNLEYAFNDCLSSLKIPAGFHLDPVFDVDELFVPYNDFVTLLAALVSNAVKHHDRDIGCILVSAFRDCDGVQLLVEDDGPGILPKDRQRVFELMTTLQSHDVREGSGMGLAVADRIVNLLQGTIEIDDPIGHRGTVFRVQLPPNVLPTNQ